MGTDQVSQEKLEWRNRAKRCSRMLWNSIAFVRTELQEDEVRDGGREDMYISLAHTEDQR